MFVDFAEVARTLVRQKGLQNRLETAQVFERFLQIIKKQWGEKTGGEVAPISFSGGILKIRVGNHILASELRLKEYAILKEVNISLPSKGVMRLQIQTI